MEKEPSHVTSDKAPSITALDKAPSPALTGKIASPVLSEDASSPVPSDKASSPAPSAKAHSPVPSEKSLDLREVPESKATEKEPSPAPTDKAPSISPLDKAPSPAPTEKTASPVLSEDAPSPVPSDKAHSPVPIEKILDLKEVSDSKAMEKEPSPVTSDKAPSITALDKAPSPALTEKIASPVLSEDASSPVPSDKASSPAPSDKAHRPVPSEKSLDFREVPESKATEKERSPAPTDKASSISPLHKAPSPALTEKIVSPVLSEKLPSDKAYSPAPSEKVHELKEVSDSKAMEKESSPETSVNAPSITPLDKAQSPALTEKIASPVLSEDASSPVPSDKASSPAPSAKAHSPVPSEKSLDLREVPESKATEKEPSPAPTDKAPSISPLDKAPSPAPTEKTASPVLSEDAPSPVPSDKAHSPVPIEKILDLKEVSDSKAMEKEPSPATSDKAPSITALDKAPSPALTEKIASPVLSEDASSPVPSDKASSPAPSDKAHSPVPSEKSLDLREVPESKATEKERSPAPTDKASSISPLHKAPSPALTEKIVSPVLSEKVPSDKAYSPAPSEKVHELKEVSDSKAMEKESSPETSVNAPSITPLDKAQSPALTEKIASPVLSEDVPSPVPSAKASSPVPSEKAHSPVPIEKSLDLREVPESKATEKEPSPAPIDKAPSITPLDKAPSPAPTENIASPVLSEDAPSPVPSDKASSPVPSEKAHSPAPSEKSLDLREVPESKASEKEPSPAPADKAPSISPLDKATSLATTEKTASPVLSENAPSPVPSDKAHSPVPSEKVIDLKVVSESKAIEKEPSPAPSDKAPSISPLEKTPSPAPTEKTASPVLSEKAPSPVPSDKTSSPVPSAKAHSPVPSEKSLDLTEVPESKATEIEPSIAPTDKAPSISPLDKAPSPAPTKKPASPVLSKKVPSPVPSDKAYSPVPSEKVLDLKEVSDSKAKEKEPSPATSDKAPSVTPLDKTPSPAPTDKTASPVLSENAQSPVPSDKALSPVLSAKAHSPIPSEKSLDLREVPESKATEKEPSPAPSDKAPSISPLDKSPSPASTGKTASPVLTEKAPSPVPSDKALSPVLSAKAHSPIPSEKSLGLREVPESKATEKEPSPAPSDKAPSISPLDKSPSPASTEKTASPVLSEKAPGPVPSAKAHSPIPSEKTLDLKELSESRVIEKEPSPTSDKEPSISPLDKAPSPAPTEETASPVLSEKALSPVPSDKASSPVPSAMAHSPIPSEKALDLKKVSESKTTEKEPSPATSEKAPTISPLDKAPCPAPTEKAASPVLSEKAPSPVPSDKALSPVLSAKAHSPIPSEKLLGLIGVTVSKATEKEPSPAPNDKEPSISPLDKAPSPAPTEKTARPVLSEKALSPVPIAMAHSPIPSKEALDLKEGTESKATEKEPSPAPCYKAARPLPSDPAPSPVPNEKVPSTVPSEKAPSLVPSEKVPSPVPNEKVLSPVPSKKAPSSVLSEKADGLVPSEKLLDLKEITSIVATEKESSPTPSDMALKMAPLDGASSPELTDKTTSPVVSVKVIKEADMECSAALSDKIPSPVLSELGSSPVPSQKPLDLTALTFSQETDEKHSPSPCDNGSSLTQTDKTTSSVLSEMASSPVVSDKINNVNLEKKDIPLTSDEVPNLVSKEKDLLHLKPEQKSNLAFDVKDSADLLYNEEEESMIDEMLKEYKLSGQPQRDTRTKILTITEKGIVITRKLVITIIVQEYYSLTKTVVQYKITIVTNEEDKLPDGTKVSRLYRTTSLSKNKPNIKDLLNIEFMKTRDFELTSALPDDNEKVSVLREEYLEEDGFIIVEKDLVKETEFQTSLTSKKQDVEEYPITIDDKPLVSQTSDAILCKVPEKEPSSEKKAQIFDDVDQGIKLQDKVSPADITKELKISTESLDHQEDDKPSPELIQDTFKEIDTKLSVKSIDDQKPTIASNVTKMTKDVFREKSHEEILDGLGGISTSSPLSVKEDLKQFVSEKDKDEKVEKFVVAKAEDLILLHTDHIKSDVDFVPIMKQELKVHSDKKEIDELSKKDIVSSKLDEKQVGLEKDIHTVKERVTNIDGDFTDKILPPKNLDEIEKSFEKKTDLIFGEDAQVSKLSEQKEPITDEVTANFIKKDKASSSFIAHADITSTFDKLENGHISEDKLSPISTLSDSEKLETDLSGEIVHNKEEKGLSSIEKVPFQRLSGTTFDLSEPTSFEPSDIEHLASSEKAPIDDPLGQFSIEKLSNDKVSSSIPIKEAISLDLSQKAHDMNEMSSMKLTDKKYSPVVGEMVPSNSPVSVEKLSEIASIPVSIVIPEKTFDLKDSTSIKPSLKTPSPASSDQTPNEEVLSQLCIKKEAYEPEASVVFDLRELASSKSKGKELSSILNKKTNEKMSKKDYRLPGVDETVTNLENLDLVTITKKEIETISRNDEKDIDEKESGDEKTREKLIVTEGLEKLGDKLNQLEVDTDIYEDGESISEDSQILDERKGSQVQISTTKQSLTVDLASKIAMISQETCHKEAIDKQENIKKSLTDDKSTEDHLSEAICDMPHGSSSEDVSKEASLEEKYSFESSEKSDKRTIPTKLSSEATSHKVDSITSIDSLTSTLKFTDCTKDAHIDDDKTKEPGSPRDEIPLSEASDSGVHSIPMELDYVGPSDKGDSQAMKDSAIHLMESIHKAFGDESVQQGIKTESLESLVRVSTPPTVPVSPLPKTPSSFQDVKISDGVQSEITYDKSDGSEETITKVVHVGEDVLTQRISTSTEKVPKKTSSATDDDSDLLTLMQTMGKIKTETDTVTKIIKEGENVVTQTITTVTTKEVISREDGTPQNIKTTIETTTLSKGADGSTTSTTDTQTLLSECSSSLRSTSSMDLYAKDKIDKEYLEGDEKFEIKDLPEKREPSKDVDFDFKSFISETDESDDNVEDTIIDTDVSKRIIRENNIDIVETVTTVTKKETVKVNDSKKIIRTTIETNVSKDHPDGTRDVRKNVEIKTEELVLDSSSNLDKILSEYIVSGEPEESVSTKTEEIAQESYIIKRTLVTRIVKTKYAYDQGVPRKLKTVTTITTTDDYPDGSSRTKVDSSTSLTDIEVEPVESFELQGLSIVEDKYIETDKQEKNVIVNGKNVLQVITTTTTKETLSSVDKTRKKLKTTVETVTDTMHPDGMREVTKDVKVSVSDIGIDAVEESLDGFEIIGKPKEDTTSEIETISEDGITIKRKKTITTIVKEYTNLARNIKRIKTTVKTVIEDEHPDGSVITKTSEKISLAEEILENGTDDAKKDDERITSTLIGLSVTGKPEESETIETAKVIDKTIVINRTIITRVVKTKYCDTQGIVRKLKTVTTITKKDKYPDDTIKMTEDVNTTITDVNNDLLFDKQDNSESKKMEKELKELIPEGKPEESVSSKSEEIIEKNVKINRTIVTKVINTRYTDKDGIPRKLQTVTTVTNTDTYPDGSTRITTESSTTLKDIYSEINEKNYKPSSHQQKVDDVVQGQDLKDFSELEDKSVSVDTKQNVAIRDGKEVNQVVTTTTTKEILSSTDGSRKKIRRTVEVVTETILPNGSTEVTKDVKVSVADFGIESFDENLTDFTQVGEPDEHKTTDTETVVENGVTITRKTTVTTVRQEFVNTSTRSKKIKTIVKTVIEDEYPDGTVITKKSEKVSIADVFLKTPGPTQDSTEPPESYIDDSEVVEDTTEESDVKKEVVHEGSLTIKRTITTKTKRETLASGDKNVKRVRTTVETLTVDEFPDGSTETTKDVKITISEFQQTSDSDLQAALLGLTSTGKIKTSVDKKTNIITELGEKITQTITTYVTKEEFSNNETNEIAVKTVTETITANAKDDGSVETTKDVRTQITYLPIGTGLDDWSPEALEEIEKQPVAQEEKLVVADKPVIEQLALGPKDKSEQKTKKQRSPVGEITTDTEVFTKVIREGDNEITQTVTVVTTKEVITPEKVKITVETTTVSKSNDGVTKTTKSTKTTISEFKEEFEETIDTGESEKSFSKLSSRTGDMRSSSAASDDLDHHGISSPPSDISSRGSRAATHVWGTESSGMYYSDDDGPGSPSSTKSQVAHSPRSNLSFELDTSRLQQEQFEKHEPMLYKDPMSTSIYGQLPDDDSCTSSTHSEVKSEVHTEKSVTKMTEKFLSQEKSAHLKDTDATFLKEADEHFEKAIEEHKKVSGSEVISNITAKYKLDTNIQSSSSHSSKEESSITLKDLKTESKKVTESCSSSKQTSKFEQSEQKSESRTSKDPIESWGKPLGLPSPILPPTQGDGKNTPKKQANSTILNKNKINQEKSKEAKSRASESPSKKKAPTPVYMELTYVPHHGNSYYSAMEFFKRVRARYYVFSGTEPSKEIYNALLDAKKTWEDKDLEVTIIPTYDTDVLGYWVTENEEALEKYKIDLSPSASRCTINLQDHETSCAAYRLEF